MRYKIRRFIGPATLNGNEVKKKKKNRVHHLCRESEWGRENTAKSVGESKVVASINGSIEASCRPIKKIPLHVQKNILYVKNNVYIITSD